MYKAPVAFIESCKEYSINENDAQKKWEKIWSQTIEQFLIWIIDNPNLSEDTLNDLNELFQSVIEKDTDKGLLELIKPILTEAEYIDSIEKLSDLYFENLNNCASELPGNTLKELRSLIFSLKTT
ncbi:hypothetical protein BH09PAT2_BH09PAT2_02370 [soil metagenome]